MPNLFDTFAVLKPELLVDNIAFTPEVYGELDKRYAGFAGHTLISAHSFKEDWQVWEMHPAGDETVILLSGQVDFVLRQDGEDVQVSLKQVGDFAVVPRGTWHTARCTEPSRVLFITPGADTRNEDAPVDD